MQRAKNIIPILAGAVAGGAIALAVASGGSTTTRSVTTTVVQPASAPSLPTSFSGGKGLSVNQIYRQTSPGRGRHHRDLAELGQQPRPVRRRRPADPGRGRRASSTTSRATSSPTSTSSPGATQVTVKFQDGKSAPAKVLGTDPSTDVGVIRVSGVGRPSSIRSRSPTPRRRRSATRWSPSAARSACRRRRPPASSARSDGASPRRTTTRSPARSRPTRRSTPATPAARCSTPPATCSGSTTRSRRTPARAPGVGFAIAVEHGGADRQPDHRRPAGQALLRRRGAQRQQLRRRAGDAGPAGSPAASGRPAARRRDHRDRRQAGASTAAFIQTVDSYPPGTKITRDAKGGRTVTLTLGTRPATSPGG